jgi:transcriptional regulator with XRE-family HTH domain
MKTVYERIKEVRLKLGLSQVDFSKQIFVSKSYYGYIETGEKGFSERILHIISTQFNVNKEWLKTGEGDMFFAPPPDVKFEMLKGIYEELDDSLRKCLVEQSVILLKLQRENGKTDRKDKNDD